MALPALFPLSPSFVVVLFCCLLCASRRDLSTDEGTEENIHDLKSQLNLLKREYFFSIVINSKMQNGKFLSLVLLTKCVCTVVAFHPL